MIELPVSQEQADARRRNRNTLSRAALILHSYQVPRLATAVEKIVAQLTDSLDAYEKEPS